MHDPGAPEEKGYELTDVQIKVLLISGILVTVGTAAAFIVSVFFIKYLNAREPITDYRPSPIADQESAWAGDVRLQPDPFRALAEHQSEQDEISRSYGVISADPEIYRIPVDTAIDIVAKSGRLPTFTVLPASAEEKETP